MSSKFVAGFEKTSGVLGAIAKPVVGAGKWLGGALIKGMGGKLNAAATALGTASDAADYSSKLKAAREGLS